jgi:hypothetical protein
MIALNEKRAFLAEKPLLREAEIQQPFRAAARGCLSVAGDERDP